jgi:hypothetical protein
MDSSDVNVAVENKFKDANITEIKTFISELKKTCDSKKQEVRLLVGERYRDLLEAADLIIGMKEQCKNATKLISSIEGELLETKETSTSPIRETSDFTLPSQIKLLMDSSEQVLISSYLR